MHMLEGGFFVTEPGRVFTTSDGGSRLGKQGARETKGKT